MIHPADRRGRDALPYKLFIGILIILAFGPLGCGSETNHGEANPYPSMHSKADFTIKKPTVSYPMEKVHIYVSEKFTSDDELQILLDGKTVPITDKNEQSVSFRGPFDEGHHQIVLIKNGIRSNTTGLNVIAYH